MKRYVRHRGSPQARVTFASVTPLRSLLVRRVIVGLALAGLVAPLAPSAEARTRAEARLADSLGHEAAVQLALAASLGAADPQEAFVLAYAEATGQDADDVRARLDGDALWLATEIPAPDAVLLTSSASPQITSPRGLSGTIPPRAPRLALSLSAGGIPYPTLDLARGERPRAHGARGP